MPRHYLRTGSILGHPDESEIWICVTPLCDLDPRPPAKDSWNGKLAPSRAMMLRRAKIVDPSKKDLKHVTKLNHIFWEYEQGIRCGLLDPMKTENVMVAQHGQINDGVVTMHRVTHDGGTLKLNEESMHVLGQLRDQNASVLLQQTGAHSARIGVDFVPPPTPKTSS